MTHVLRVSWVILWVAIGAFAQAITATVAGTARDQTGAVLPGVEVTITNPGTALTRSVVTNERGEYVISLLPVGSYEMTATLTGFRTELHQNIILQVNQRSVINFELQIGELTDRVLVTEAAPLVQSETSDVGGVIENRRVVQLPLDGRQFQNLALLVPGAFSSPEGSAGGFRGAITIGGVSESSTVMTLDGVDMTSKIGYQPVLKPSIDLIQEFKVQTSRYSAEYGGKAGAQVTVTTKSGTNNFHGTLYEFVRNNIFDAKNFFDPPDEAIPGYKRNQFGGTIGGPIVRDRTFFFASYEGLRLRQAITRTASVPSSEMVSGNFSEIPTRILDPLTGQAFPGNIIPQDRIHPIGQAIARLFPKPNLSGTQRNFVSSPVDKQRIDQISVRVDHRFSDSNSLFGRYTFVDDVELDPFDQFSGITNLPGYGRYDDQYGVSISLSDTHVFSPNLVGELRLGYTRFSQLRVMENRDNITAQLGIPGTSTNSIDFGHPTVRVTGYDAIGKDNLPSDRSDNIYQLMGNMTVMRRSHTIKFGSEVAQFGSMRLNNSLSGAGGRTNGRGSFRFSGQYTGHPLADLLLGVPHQTGRSLGDTRNPQFVYVYGFYLQDDWKVTPRLTLNMGLRYDWQTPMFTTMDRLSRFDPVTKVIEVTGTPNVRRDIVRPDNPISPYFNPELAALARTVKMVDLGKRSLYTLDKNDFGPRFGLAYRVLGNDSLVLRTGYGLYFDGASMQSAGWRSYPFLVTQFFNAHPTRPDITLGDPFPASLAIDTITTESIEPHLVTPDVQQYNLGFQYQPLTDFLIDVSYVGNKSTHVPRSRNINQALPGLIGSVASRRPDPTIGDVTQSEQSGNSNFNSLQLRIEKRSSEGATVMLSHTWSKWISDVGGGSTADNGRAQNHHNLSAERALDASDARHRLAVSYVYPFPFGSGKRFFTNAQGFGNWLASGWQISGISTFQSGRPMTVVIRRDNSNTGASSSDRPNLIGNPHLPRGERSPDRWFNTNAFSIPPRGTFGNLGRNTLVGPGLFNTDISLMKSNRISENTSMQFRAEFFNATNHPNFHVPNLQVDSPQFGQIFSAGFSRQIQFGLKLIY